MAAPDREPRTPKARPDPRPMRFTLGVTGLVAATAMATSIIRPPAPPAAGVAPEAASVSATPPPPLVIRHVTQYVQLKPGQTPPPGAKVVQKPEASPRVVYVTVPAPTARTIVITTTVTRQSGAK